MLEQIHAAISNTHGSRSMSLNFTRPGFFCREPNLSFEPLEARRTCRVCAQRHLPSGDIRKWCLLSNRHGLVSRPPLPGVMNFFRNYEALVFQLLRVSPWHELQNCFLQGGAFKRWQLSVAGSQIMLEPDDVFLVLAQSPAGPSYVRTLTWPMSIQIIRLKYKLGNRSNALERRVSLHGAYDSLLVMQGWCI